MTINTTFMDDLYRVRIELSSLTDVDAVKIERALLTADDPWQIVRGGVALPIVLGAGQLDDYEYGDAVLNHYRVTRALPVPGLILPGTADNYASTPDNAALDITGDIELRAYAAADNWSLASDQTLVAKFVTGALSYRLLVNDGFLIFQVSTDGTSFWTSFSSIPIPAEDGELIGLRALMDANNGAGGHTVSFWTGPSIDGPWTRLGDNQVTAVTITIFSGVAPLEVGSRNYGTSDLFTGTIAAAKVISDPFGTPAEVANPDFAAEADGTTTFTDDAGRTWALNPPWLDLPGVSGDYASTPDNAALDITADLDIRADATLTSWTAVGTRTFCGKYNSTGNQESYRLSVITGGILRLNWTTDGSTDITRDSTVAVPVTTGRLAVRATLDVDNGAAGHTVQFWTGPSINGPWTLLGTSVITAGVTSIFSGSAVGSVGAINDGTGGLLTGRMHAAQIRSGINGTIVANPDFSIQAVGAASFVDSAGRTWTMNGNADIVAGTGAEILTGDILETDSITPDNGGLTILKSIKYPALNRAIADPDYRPVQRASRTGVYNVKGRVPPIAIHDAWTSQWWTIETVTESLAQARDMDLVLAASGTLFIQVPPETENECFTNPVSGMPGGYVYVLNSTMSHSVHGSHVMAWTIPVRVVAPPGPEIMGTTITWAALERLYGSWTALWASNPTWRDVWNQIMDPEDAIVL